MALCKAFWVNLAFKHITIMYRTSIALKRKKYKTSKKKKYLEAIH
jgi:hypothetical protein